MKIWSDTLTLHDLRECALEVNGEFPGCALGIEGGELIEGPRTRRIVGAHLRSVYGWRKANTGSYGSDQDGYYAASWTEWGWWLVRLFERDPSARILAARDYRGLPSFHQQTGFRFMDPRTPRERQLRRELTHAARRGELAAA